MIIQHTLSLRCQASRWLSGAFPQSLPSFQKCQKSLPAHPAPSHRQRKIQQKATKQFNIQIDNNNGQISGFSWTGAGFIIRKASSASRFPIRTHSSQLLTSSPFWRRLSAVTTPLRTVHKNGYPANFRFNPVVKRTAQIGTDEFSFGTQDFGMRGIIYQRGNGYPRFAFSKTSARTNKSPFFPTGISGAPIPPETGISFSGVITLSAAPALKVWAFV